MIEENEVVMFLLSMTVLVFIYFNYRSLKKIASFKILAASFFFFALSSLFTIVEGFIYPTFFNYLEHGSDGLSAVLLFVWLLKGSAAKKEVGNEAGSLS